MEPRTLCELFYGSVDSFNKETHLLYKKDGKWTPISSREFREAVEELSMGLRELGVHPGDRVAILAENRPEWAMADLACLTAAAIDAPIYATLTPPQVLYILKDCGAKVIFVSNETQARKIAEVRAGAPDLKHVVMMEEPLLPGMLEMAAVRAKGRAALVSTPNAVRERAATVKPEDVATLIYTSGTTGDPKGVMLTHANLVSNVMASTKVFADLKEDDISLSFLPLCHVFERMAGHYLLLQVGAVIAYAEGFDKVPQNLLEVRPSLVLSVPRLYEKVYARVHEKVAADSPMKQRIFRWAIGVGKDVFRHRVHRTTPGFLLRLKWALADRLVFSKIRERTGGRIKLFVSGAAPLSRDIAEFFGAVGLLILEGYGLTETSPVIAVNRPDALKPGTVGRPVDKVEVKIAPDGEILARGPNIMKGYYHKPEATAEAIEPDGWFHTGDIGALDAEGFLTITDRKKDLIVTSGGKKVAPQPIESLLKADPLIAECVMIGNRRNFPAALLVPNFENLERWAREKGIVYKDRKDLISNPEVVTLYHDTVAGLSRDLAQFEKIKKLTLLDTEFSIEAGQLTPTLKVKRRVVEEQFKGLIDRMYATAAAE
jgi:long-chain acyl-CoA synthetase